MCTEIVYKMTDKGKSVTRKRPHRRQIAANANQKRQPFGRRFGEAAAPPDKNFPALKGSYAVG